MPYADSKIKKEESVQEAQLTILARSINKVKPVLNLKKGFSGPPEKDNYSPARQAPLACVHPFLGGHGYLLYR